MKHCERALEENDRAIQAAFTNAKTIGLLDKPKTETAADDELTDEMLDSFRDQELYQLIELQERINELEEKQKN